MAARITGSCISVLSRRPKSAFSGVSCLMTAIWANSCSYLAVAVAKSKQSSRADRRKKAPELSNPETQLAQVSEAKASEARPSRKAVLQACFITCGGMTVAGLITRQASHFLAEAGYFTSHDCVKLLPFNYHSWHSGAILELVVFVSLLRQLLLRLWPDFARSSDEANRQVLSSLQPLDYVTVAFSSGLSEELLFRGALLPLLGLDARGIAISGAIFGVLHLTGGRNAAFALWAFFVGAMYGTASIWTNDLYVPIASHSLANLVAGWLWKYRAQNDTGSSSA